MRLYLESRYGRLFIDGVARMMEMFLLLQDVVPLLTLAVEYNVLQGMIVSKEIVFLMDKAVYLLVALLDIAAEIIDAFHVSLNILLISGSTYIVGPFLVYCKLILITAK